MFDIIKIRKERTMTKYEVWQVGGGYFQTFKQYTKARDLVEQLEKEYPSNMFQIIEVY